MITPKEYFQETDRMLVRASVNSEEYPVDKEVLRTFYGYYGPHEQFKDWCRDNLDDINKLNDKVEEIEDELGDAKNALKDFKWDFEGLIDRLKDAIEAEDTEKVKNIIEDMEYLT